ncbi:hypothetical protein BCV70DRAFT_196717 [Testicularia cyperi]|uniref:Uncharacterized protein n=1 Tax=Testicularia cyperi TaxID=1882483 RepID=A0A317XXB9_9BASI|nr:hypothetical protein BCV70DRAFT_196717 [Testicularia cyperi]
MPRLCSTALGLAKIGQCQDFFLSSDQCSDGPAWCIRYPGGARKLNGTSDDIPVSTRMGEPDAPRLSCEKARFSFACSGASWTAQCHRPVPGQQSRRPRAAQYCARRACP